MTRASWRSAVYAVDMEFDWWVVGGGGGTA
jgi:hypothetical protein